MRNVLTFVALAALACQSSARVDIASPIEKSAIKLLLRCELIAKERHHKDIDPKKLRLTWFNTRTHKEITSDLEEASKVFQHEYDFKQNDPVYLYVPGFNANPKSHDVIFIKDGLLKLKNVNYVLLDSSFYLEHDDELIPQGYVKAASNVYGIGQVLGDVLAKFIQGGLRPEQLHVFGHSLGAHLVGYAAQRVYDVSRKKLKRISGIDPALPCFDELEITDQISAEDAEYVDIYHSSMGVAGTKHSLGTANFFINGGGPLQPSCIDLPYLSQDCSHVFNSVSFWVASALEPEKFLAQKCDSYEHLKEGKCNSWPKATAGLFSEPCKGDYYIEFEFDYGSQVINMITTAIARVWHKMISIFGYS